MIRKAVPEDTAGMAGMLRNCGFLSWREEDLLRLLQDENGVVLVSEHEGGLSGFAFGSVVLDEAELLNIGVLADTREAGLGSALLTALHEAFYMLGARTVYLEVSASNTAALTLYRRAGYVQNGRRAGYYPNGDDALLLFRVL